MSIPRVSVFFALAWTVGSAVPAHGQTSTPDSVLYALVAPPSEFQYGCFGPCECAVFVRSPLTGTLVLRRSRVDPLYTWYDVIDVRWKAPDPTHSIEISGSGYYRRGGEVAVQEELSLDLRFDGGPIQHFYSGLRSPGATFPEIKTQVSIHPYMCFDSVLVVDARPANGVVGVGDDAFSIATHPNPFGTTTEIGFALAEPGRVSLGVFDLSGRKVRDILRSQWMTGGPQSQTWDGRTENGSEASAGLYFLRLETPAGTIRRTVVKLR